MRFPAEALLLFALAGCGATGGLESYGDRERAPSALAPERRGPAVAARVELDRGDAAAARALLEQAVAAAPGDIGMHVMLQEAELAAGENAEALRERYRTLARERDDATAWILAARLESDGTVAAEDLERALARDKASAWAYYGQAYLMAREGLWTEARERLDRALGLDPAHLPARRLEAALFARDGRLEEASEAFEAWLEASAEDPRVDPVLRLATELDLAMVELESGRPRAARERLARLGEAVGPATSAGRRLCLLAATEQALGHSELALEAARRAEEANPESPLPKVQQALLYEQWLGDPTAAREAWQRVLGRARTSTDLTDLIQSMRARVVLERLEAASGAREPGAARNPTPSGS